MKHVTVESIPDDVLDSLLRMVSWDVFGANSSPEVMPVGQFEFIQRGGKKVCIVEAKKEDMDQGHMAQRWYNAISGL